jgi:hypothetical protein
MHQVASSCANRLINNTHRVGAPQSLQAVSALASKAAPVVTAAAAPVVTAVVAHGGLLAMGAAVAPVAIPFAIGAGLLYLVSRE